MDPIVKQFTDLVAQNDWDQGERWEKYYRGVFELPYLPSVNQNAIAREYADLLSRADLPICSLVVAAVVDRLQVDGFRSPDALESDKTVWDWWSKSNLDARQTLVYRDSLVFGDGFVSVVPDGDRPKFSIESPLNIVAQYDPTDPTRVETAVKMVGERGWLWTDDAIYALKKNTVGSGFNDPWVVVSAIDNLAGEVPLVRFPNRMDSRGVTPVSYTHLTLPTNREV